MHSKSIKYKKGTLLAYFILGIIVNKNKNGGTHIKVSTEEISSGLIFCEVQSESFIHASTLCRTLDRLCDWILA